jgi:lipopolysaccharide/colanic/teichoic acid biosynthesis glycosyltransferase
MSELRVDVSSIVGDASDISRVIDVLETHAYRPRVEYVDEDAIPPLGKLAKRCLDLLIAVPSLVVALPVMAAAAIVIRLESKGPSIYRSTRMGLGNVPFTCYKLRTMVMNADALREKMRHLSYREGATFKIEDDPRVTSAGRILRKFSLDELPQLWNVIRGEMSIVGPRPHSMDDVARYSEQDLQRHRVKPGLTGLWQISARKDPSFRRNMELDCLYIHSWSLRSDLAIILKTFPVIIRGEGE